MFFIGLFSSFFPWLILVVVYSFSFGLYYVCSSDRQPGEEEDNGDKITIHPGHSAQEAAESVLSYEAYIYQQDECGQESAIADSPDEHLAVPLRSGLDDESSSGGITPGSGVVIFSGARKTTQSSSKAPDDFIHHPDFLLFSRPPPLY